MPYTEKFLNALNALPDALIYLLLGLSAFVENLFPPIPGDTITVFGAFLVGTGKLSFLGVYVATTAGSLVGFLTLFWLAGLLGRRFFIERDFRFLKAEQIMKAEAWFDTYGFLLIALNRFLPGVRSAVSIAAGLARFPLSVVGLLALLSCAVWNLIWILLGQTLGKNWDAVEARMSSLMTHYRNAVLISLGVILLLLWLRKKWTSRK
jgi:membrane protein DedA with SNARE-associated domain